MRELKSELVNAEEQRDIVILQNIPQHQGLVKANRVLLLLASSLMVIVFILGFLLIPTGNMLDKFTSSTTQVEASAVYTIENPVLSAEIKALKSQFVGLISGSIESKLRMLEESIRKGSIITSLDTVEDLRADVKVLQAYSAPLPVSEKRKIKNQGNVEILKEVSQLKTLIYLTLTSCGLMIAAIGGFWVRRHFRLGQPDSSVKVGLVKKG
jgi:cell division protein FtsB